ncbi:uncharacterized protein Z518_05144 [Rhinocladiella mackenziei CBS 650.93]|uniref:RNA exonuclease 4 n=1 Tax=Rhinocladiella mackenziei CBS 650.93 TaxID=1442369 RepID=A0A0D2FPZ5_9EURO|nr:uncharacterized protein Z518_05144 [Rhinocladiella mackenziei CBS 650.93]KIX04277.1 hypothetical protein Z518_05144 [Rhinocladiella mackenziei CBS 650.93]
MDQSNLSSNWKKLQATFEASKPDAPPPKPSLQNGLKRKRDQFRDTLPQLSAQLPNPRNKQRVQKAMAQKGVPSTKLGSIQDLENHDDGVRPRFPDRASSENVNGGLSPSVEVGRYVAIDCEMVGVGPNPDRESALARVSIVNYNGEQVYDSYVVPLETVTDWRTPISGIAPKHMKYARSMKEVQADVAKIIKDRVLIGHAIRHDLEALMLGHPKRDIRDTSRHPPYRKLTGGNPPRLKILASELLGFEIQEGEHSSIEDARACMLLFRRDKAAFEREHSKKWPIRTTTDSQRGSGDQQKPQKSEKKKKRGK